jgi:hypothetical protein
MSGWDGWDYQPGISAWDIGLGYRPGISAWDIGLGILLDVQLFLNKISTPPFLADSNGGVAF